MIFFKILITIYLYFLGLITICYITKNFLEVLENAKNKKRIKHTKQYRNRK